MTVLALMVVLGKIQKGKFFCEKREIAAELENYITNTSKYGDYLHKLLVWKASLSILTTSAMSVDCKTLFALTTPAHYPTLKFSYIVD